MPLLPSKLREQRDNEYRAFADSSLWLESQNNSQNIWRHFEGMTLVVFVRKGDGYFGWFVADSGNKQFSRQAFDSQVEAMQDLFDYLHLT